MQFQIKALKLVLLTVEDVGLKTFEEETEIYLKQSVRKR